jgi:lipooligosaccharide transport system permease protein
MTSGRWLRATSYWTTSYKRTWRGTLFSSFLAPVLFLTAMGKGLGSLVDANDTLHSGFGVSYVSFLAPGLLASSTLMVTAQEATYPVNGAVRWNRSYIAMVNTPLRPEDAMWGHLAFMIARAMSVAAMFVAIMFVFGAIESPWVLAAIPTAAIGGMAVAAPMSAFSVQLESDGGFAAVNRFILTPMMLFAGAFFPVTQLPAAIRPIAYATPMWHSVDLARTLALGHATLARTAGHLAALAGFITVGVLVSRRNYRRVLTP